MPTLWYRRSLGAAWGRILCTRVYLRIFAALGLVTLLIVKVAVLCQAELRDWQSCLSPLLLHKLCEAHSTFALAQNSVLARQVHLFHVA